MKTLNSLKIELEEITSKHDFLNAFFYGDVLEIMSTNQPKIYPAIFCTIETGADEKFFNNFTVELQAFDKVSDDHKELVEVESDTYQYLSDFLNIMRYSPRWQHFSTIKSITAIKRKFIDLTKDNLTGWNVIIDVGLKANFGICDLPLTGYDFGPGVQPPPLTDPIDISLNGILMRANQTSDVDIPIFKFGTTDPLGSGTEGNPFFISTVGSDDLEKGTVVAGVLEIADSSITANGDALEEVVSEIGFDVEILDSVTLDPADTSVVGNKVHVVTGGGPTTIAYCYPRTRQTDVFEGELLGEGQLFKNGVYNTSLVGVAPVLDNDFPFYKLDITTPGTLPNIFGNEFKWTGKEGGYIDEFDVFHLLNGDVTTRALAFPDDVAFNNYNGLDYSIDTVSTTTRSQLDSESFVDGLTFGGFSDWRVCHPGESDEMGQFNNSNAFANGLFNYAVTNHWTNETTPNNPLHGRYYNISDGSTLRRQVKTTNSRFFMCRTHTFT